MTDFGTVEDLKPRGVRRDITLGGVYLMKMLTGYTPKYSLGDLFENVVSRIQHDESLSFGVKRLLVLLLHPKPDQRPQSANEVTGELYNMTAWWNEQPESLVQGARSVFEKAQAMSGEGEQLEEKERLLARSMTMIDIATRKGLDVDEYFVENVKGALRGSSSMERAKALYYGRSYDLAKKVLDFHKEISDNPSQMRRFGYLCLAGQDISPSTFVPHRDKFQEAFDLMDRQQYPEALDLLNRTKTQLVDALQGATPEGPSSYDTKVLQRLREQKTGIDLLRFDCEMNIAMEKANKAMRSSDYKAAQEHYEVARSFQDLLPDKAFVVTYETGDLDQRITEASVLARTDQKAAVTLDELSETMVRNETVDRRKVLATIEEAFRTTDHHEVVFEHVQQLVERVLSTGDVQLASEMIDRIPVSPLPDRLIQIRTWTDAERVRTADRAGRFLQGGGDVEENEGKPFETFKTLDELMKTLENIDSIKSQTLQRTIGTIIYRSSLHFAQRMFERELKDEAKLVVLAATKYEELVRIGKEKDSEFIKSLSELYQSLSKMRKAAQRKGFGD